MDASALQAKLLLIGDDNVHRWNDHDGRGIFENFFVSPFGAVAAGIPGDTTTNVRWRIQNDQTGISRPLVTVKILVLRTPCSHRIPSSLVVLSLTLASVSSLVVFPSRVCIATGTGTAAARVRVRGGEEGVQGRRTISWDKRSTSVEHFGCGLVGPVSPSPVLQGY